MHNLSSYAMATETSWILFKIIIRFYGIRLASSSLMPCNKATQPIHCCTFFLLYIQATTKSYVKICNGNATRAWNCRESHWIDRRRTKKLCKTSKGKVEENASTVVCSIMLLYAFAFRFIHRVFPVYVHTGFVWIFDLACGLKNSSASVCYDLFALFMHALKCDAVIETNRIEWKWDEPNVEGRWVILDSKIRRMAGMSIGNLGDR